MAKWADTQGRFLFAPDALARARPYIDRIETLVRIPVPSIVRSSIPGFLDNLRGEVFCSRNGYASSIRERWLFGGNVRLYPGTIDGSTTNLELRFILNPTRFLQANAIPNSAEHRAQMFEAPRSFLEVQPGSEIAQRLEQSRQVTFDRNDNFLFSLHSSISPIADWPRRTTEYVALTYQVVRTELIRAARRAVSGEATAQMFPEFEHLAVQVSQAEFYWEFGVDNAVRKVADTQDLFASQLLTSFRNRYPVPGGPELGRRYNSNLVRGNFGHQDVTAKLYAKSSHVVRFEISFTRRPWSVVAAERKRQTQVGNAGGARLIPMLDALSAEAMARSDRLWQSFWRAVPREINGDQIGLKQLFNLLSRSVEGSGVSPSEILEILLNNGSIAPFTRGSDRSDPVRRLKDWGVLTRTRTSSTRNARYQISNRFAPVLEEIGRMPDNAPLGARSQNPLAHEDTLAVRVRPRQFLRLS